MRKVEDGRKVELAPGADDELHRVADPPLIPAWRLEPAVQEIRRDRLIVIAHRHGPEAFPHARRHKSSTC